MWLKIMNKIISIQWKFKWIKCFYYHAFNYSWNSFTIHNKLFISNNIKSWIYNSINLLFIRYWNNNINNKIFCNFITFYLGEAIGLPYLFIWIILFLYPRKIILNNAISISQEFIGITIFLYPRNLIFYYKNLYFRRE